MKKILGLDLGTTSIGWAFVNEAESNDEHSSIIKLGVRVNPLSSDEIGNFQKGKSITTNAERTAKRSARRNLQRYKLRRNSLKEILISSGIIDKDSSLYEPGNLSAFKVYENRAKAVTEQISLIDFAKVLLMINKKRGYKSSRKAKSDDEGVMVDSMGIAKLLYEKGITPGEYTLSLLKQGKTNIPDFYISDLQSEYDKIWECQSKFYPDILTDEFKTQLIGKGNKNTSSIFLAKYKIYTADNKGKDKKLQAYSWRAKAVSEKLNIEEVAYVISDLNGIINNSSGYLGAISDRSKELYFNNQTIGQYLWENIKKNPHYSIKNKVFYRQDYIEEFDRIWDTQSIYHKELTEDLKKVIKDNIIFYQRPLKSQKGLISFCELESKQVTVNVNGKDKVKTLGCRVCPKSSPLFQEFKIWQGLNNIQVKDKSGSRFLTDDEKKILYKEVSYKPKISDKAALSLLFNNTKGLSLNYKSIEGNSTISALFKAFNKIVEASGHGSYDFESMDSAQTLELVREVFGTIGIDISITSFNPLLKSKEIETQPMYMLWHLLYSYEGDKSVSGIASLIDKLSTDFGLAPEYAKILASVTFQPDYGSLSSKAIKKILPYLMEGNVYSQACEYAGYKHSKNSLTKEELDTKELKPRLEELPKNSLRNPVVEKILNQMVNVVNSVIDEYGTPDEVRIELARELKKSAKEKEDDVKMIAQATKANEDIKKIIQSEFNIQHVSKNDIIRYKLYKELEPRGYKTLYSNTYIPKEDIFSNKFDIEHIIPQARLFDDSFSNKTLEARDINIEKGSSTAYDYILNKWGNDAIEQYEYSIKELLEKGYITRAKYNKLKLKGEEIGEGFIDRELRDSQYIAKKSKELLESIVRRVISTTGSITKRLREDWQLIDVMQELNWDKYNKLGLTQVIEGRDGKRIKRIKDWTKRNDHRHHAMDALTIAFTKESYIQYLNNLNARSDKGSSIYAIQQKELERDANNKLVFKLPVQNFRSEAKKHLESVIVSIKAKNKVTTSNYNITKAGSGNKNRTLQLTPRGQLHLETVYAKRRRYDTRYEKVNASFTQARIMMVANKRERLALLNRLKEYSFDPKKAFTGKNTLEKNPIYLDSAKTISIPSKVKMVDYENIYTIRKDISPDLNIDKVVDAGIRKILQDRLDMFGGDPKKAFSNLDINPIWLNKEKGISIKRVSIFGISNAIALHKKRDYNGNIILDCNGTAIESDFVNTGNNHHVAIYRDIDGNLQESIVSFYEATKRASNGMPIVDREYNKELGWEFLFTMKQNECFVFPNPDTGFNPKEIDLKDSANYSIISPNLYRVQKLASKYYVFRHHLETGIEDRKELQNITWKRIQSLNQMDGLIKVRINHIGKIVDVGE